MKKFSFILAFAFAVLLTGNAYSQQDYRKLAKAETASLTRQLNLTSTQQGAIYEMLESSYRQEIQLYEKTDDLSVEKVKVLKEEKLEFMEDILDAKQFIDYKALKDQ